MAAFADNELAGSAAHRARVHLVQCDVCRFDTHSQRGTADWLRGTHLAEDVRAPAIWWRGWRRCPRAR